MVDGLVLNFFLMLQQSVILNFGCFILCTLPLFGESVRGCIEASPPSLGILAFTLWMTAFQGIVKHSIIVSRC